MGAINWHLKDLVTFPLICWLSSAVMYLQQKDTSHLQSRNLLEITAIKNVTKSEYQDYSEVLTLKQRNIAMWSAQYDSSAKNTCCST